jgi:hypothetical protein
MFQGWDCSHGRRSMVFPHVTVSEELSRVIAVESIGPLPPLIHLTLFVRCCCWMKVGYTESLQTNLTLVRHYFTCASSSYSRSTTLTAKSSSDTTTTPPNKLHHRMMNIMLVAFLGLFFSSLLLPPSSHCRWNGGIFRRSNSCSDCLPPPLAVRQLPNCNVWSNLVPVKGVWL